MNSLNIIHKHNQPLAFENQRSPPQAKRNRQRNITWYNPHYSKNVKPTSAKPSSGSSTNISIKTINSINDSFLNKRSELISK